MKLLKIKMTMLLVIFLSIVIGNTMQHEVTHKQIYNKFNIDSKMHWRWNPVTPAYVLATNGTEEYQNCNESCHALQAQNEIVGYNVMTIWCAMFAIFFLHTIYKELDKLEEKKWIW